MELTTCNLFQPFTIEVRFVFFGIGGSDPRSPLVSVENLPMLGVIVPVLAKLEAGVFAHAPGSTLVVQENLVLETY